MSDHENAYIQQGYDPAKATKAELRNILQKHDVNTAALDSKAEYVAAFQTYILPQTAKLRRQRDRIRRTSEGIMDMTNSQRSSAAPDTDDEDRAQMPPPKTPRGRTPRTSRRSEMVEGVPESVPRTGARRSKTPTNRRITSLPQQKAPVEERTDSEIEPAVAQSTRRTKKVTPGPVAVIPAPSTATKVRRSILPDDEGSPFTQNNIFQSGSSPPPTTSRSKSKQRRSEGLPGEASVRKSASKTRKVRSEQFELPVSHISRGADGVDVTEEFAPEEAEEYAQEIAASKQLRKERGQALTRIRKSQRPKSNVVRNIGLGLLAILAAAGTGFYRQEKVAIGYCGTGARAWSLHQYEWIPEWVHENLEPQCEQCPLHAFCGPDMAVTCDTGFVKREAIPGLSTLWPIPPVCEPDTEKNRKVKAVANRAVEVLRDVRASYECGSDAISSTTLLDPTTNPPDIKGATISESSLKSMISSYRSKTMNLAEYEDLWESAIGDIKARDEVISSDGYLTSLSHVNLPLSCALRLSTLDLLRRNRISLLGLVTLVSAVFYLYTTIISSQNARKQVPSLVAMTLDRLSTQAALKEDGRTQEPFIAVGQLRDDVLRNVFDKSQREATWKRVAAIVEKNSNVRASQREGVKTGEWSRVWEWIGPIAAIEYSPGQGTRRSIGGGGTPSGGDIGEQRSSSPLQRDEDGGIVTSRRWDEGRAIY